jgi:spore coat polysaccharide biosynthesis protein SpsF
MKVALAIQARLGSTRLKEKVLLDINGKPMIDHIIKQARAVSAVSEILLTTSDSPLDQKLVTHFKNQGRRSFAGPVDDIVGRLNGVVNVAEADYLIRIWGDCVFICPDVIEAMLEKAVSGKFEFVSNAELKNRSFPPGLDAEIYSAGLLAKMDREVTEKPQREFPIEYVKKSSARHYFFQVSDLPFTVNQPLSSDLHLTVDYPEDLEAVKTIFGKLCPNSEVFNFKTLCEFGHRNTELFRMFSHNERNIEYREYLKQKVNP